MTGYIYFITNKVDKKSYIGKTFDPVKRKYEHFRRLRLGKHVNSKLQNAFNKYGEENFEYRHIEFECDDESELDQLEIDYIESENSHYDGYNLTLGGESGVDIKKYHFNFDDYAVIRLGGEKYKGMGNRIAKYYGASHTVVNRIIRGESYFAFQPRFEKLSDAEKDSKIKEFESIFDVIDSNVNKNPRRKIMTNEERLCSICVLHQDPDLTGALANHFNCSKEVFYRLSSGKTYKHVHEQFLNLSEQEKSKIGDLHIAEWNLRQFAASTRSRARSITDQDMFTFYGGLDVGIQYQTMAQVWGLNVKTVKCWKDKSNRGKTFEKYILLPESDKEKYREKAKQIFLP